MRRSIRFSTFVIAASMQSGIASRPSPLRAQAQKPGPDAGPPEARLPSTARALPGVAIVSLQIVKPDPGWRICPSHMRNVRRILVFQTHLRKARNSFCRLTSRNSGSLAWRPRTARSRSLATTGAPTWPGQMATPKGLIAIESPGPRRTVPLRARSILRGTARPSLCTRPIFRPAVRIGSHSKPTSSCGSATGRKLSSRRTST